MARKKTAEPKGIVIPMCKKCSKDCKQETYVPVEYSYCREKPKSKTKWYDSEGKGIEGYQC